MTTTFLLRGMSQELRKRLEREAKREKISFQEVIRSILCEHYTLDCPRMSKAARPAEWTSATTILLKMPVELWVAIKRDSEESGEAMRTLVLEALEGRYAEEAVT